MTDSALTPMNRSARWRKVLGGLSALFADILICEYAAFGLYYLAHRQESNEPEWGEPSALILLAACAAFAGLLVNCFFDGLGPRAARLRLVTLEGEPAPIGRRALRAAAWLVSGPPLLWGYLWALCDERGRSLHDRLSGTEYRDEVKVGTATVVIPWHRLSAFWIAAGLVVLTYAVGWVIAEIKLGELWSPDNLKLAAPLASALVRPSLDMDVVSQCVWAMVETIYLALVATTLAVPIAIVLSFFAARNIMPRTVLGTGVYTLMRALFTITRSIEPIVWAIIFVTWVGVGPYAGMLALFIHSVAALGKLYSEQVESIDPGPVEAIRATGAGPVHTVVYAVWPQVVPPFVAFTLYRWDINVRMATIVGLVGGGGIGYLLYLYQGRLMWAEVALIVWIITLVVWLMDTASARIRERMG